MSDQVRYDGPGSAIAPDVLWLPLTLSNVAVLGRTEKWVLVDAGLFLDLYRIRGGVEAWVGADRPPEAIILTHGHFDHVGSLEPLLERWPVTVYAHPDELPYLQGQKDYPPGDPSVGGGLMSMVSSLYPHDGINLGDRVRPLPADGTVPGAPGWRWLHTPGHTPGHVCLFRESDRTLVSGDAFITVDQESALAVLMQREELNGPPAYFTTDWTAARESVRMLAKLQPLSVAPGHGRPMSGEELIRDLEDLARDFDEVAIPDQGRYVPPDLSVNP